MSNKVDQRIVEMRFENSQFEKGVSQSISSLDKLKQSLNFDKSISKSSFDSVASNISGLSSSVDTIAERFTNLGVIGVGALMNIGATAVDVGKTIVQNLMNNITAGYERYNEMMQSQQTIMYATRSDWEDTDAQMEYINAQIEKLNWYTDETSYNLTDMTSSIGKFVSAGVPLDDAVVDMMGIASWAAISGQNAQKASYAMYNLSQAMAMGKLTNLDWKSIENANMATREFKQVAIDAGLAAGTLWRGMDDLVYGFDQYGHEIEVNVDNFRTTLAGGWLDRDVLNATLREYGDFAKELNLYVEKTGYTTTELLQLVDQAVADGINSMEDTIENDEAGRYLDDMVKKLGLTGDAAEIMAEAIWQLSAESYELGRAAFKAGQECKTLNDALDYTKDAVTTGWMNIFEKIFGDYLESKDLWTEVAEVLYEQLVRPVEELGEIFDNAYELGAFTYLKDGLFNLYDTFNQVTTALKEGWAEVFRSFTGLDLTIFLIKFRNFSRNFKLVDLPYYSDIENIKNTAISLGNALNVFVTNLKKIGQSVKDAWERIFPKKVTTTWTTDMKSFTDKVLEFAQGVEKLAEKFELTDSQAKKLERTFAGVFAIFDMIRMAIVAFIKPLSTVDVEVGSFADTILDVTAGWGDWVVAWHDWMQETGFFDQVASKVYEFFGNIPVWADQATMALFGMHLDEFFNTIGENIGLAVGAILLFFVDLPENARKAFEFVTGETDFLTWWDNLKDKVKEVWDNIQEFFTNLPQKMDDLSQALFGTDWGTVWAEIQTGVYNAYQDVAKFFGFIEEYDENGFKKNSPFQQMLMDLEDMWDELVAKFEEIKGKLEPVGDWLVENVFSQEGMEEAGKVLKTAGIIGSIAAILFLLWKVFAQVKEIIGFAADIKGSKTSNKGLFGKLSELFGPAKWLRNVMDDAEAAMGNIAKVIKGGYFALIGLLVLELAVSLFLISKAMADNPAQVIAGFIMLMGGFILIVEAGIELMSIAPLTEIDKIGKAFAMMGFVFIEIAAALYILKDIPVPQMIASMIALAALFAIIAIVLGYFEEQSAIGSNLEKVSAAIFIMSVAIVVLAFAINMIAGLEFEQIANALFGIIILMVALFAFSVLLDKTGAGGGLAALSMGFISIGVAILFMGAAMLLAGVGIKLAAEGISILVDAILRMGDAMATPQQLGEAIVEFFVGIATAITENRETLTQGLTDLWMIFIDTFNNVMPELLAAIQNFILGFLDMLITIWPQIEQFLLMAGETALALLRQLVMGLLTIINEAMPLIFEHIRMVLEFILNLLIDYVPRLAEALFNLAMQSLELLASNIGHIIALLVQIAIELVLGFIEGITNEIPRIVEVGWNFIIGLLEGIADGIDNNIEEFKAACEHIATSMKKAFCVVLGLDPDKVDAASSVFKGFGGSIMQGLIDGINSMVEGVKSAISWVSDTLKNTFTSDTEIASPSKVFRRYGRYIDEGLIKGIQDETPEVATASDRLANIAISNVAKAISNISDVIDSDLDTEPTIRPVMDLTGITNDFNTLDSMLNARRSTDLAIRNDNFIANRLTPEQRFNNLMSEFKASVNGNMSPTNQTNTFNINGAKDPKAIANEVSSIIQKQVNRRNAVWE